MLKLSQKLDDIYKYLVAAILIIVPLFPKFPFIRVSGTFVSIRIEDFLLVITALLLVPKFTIQIRKLFKDKLVWAIALFLAVGLVSLFSGIFVTKTVTAHIGFLHWLRRVEYFIPFFLGINALKDRKNLEFYLKILMISIVIIAVYGYGQKNFEWPIIITQNQEYSKGVALRYIPGGHINSTFAGHYDLSTFLVFLLPVYVSLFFIFLQKSKGILTKIALFVIVSASLWLLAVSGSRISTVSFVLSASTALFLLKKYKEIPILIIFSLIIFSFSPSLLARYQRIIDVSVEKVFEVKDMLISSTNFKEVYAQDVLGIPERRDLPPPTPTPVPVFEDRSTSIRFNVEWPRALRALSKNPLLGTGYSSITLATDNDYLRILGEIGIIGILAFGLIFARIGSKLMTAFPVTEKFSGLQQAYVAGIVGSHVGIFLNAVFIDVFEASKFAIIYWLMMGLLVSILSNKANE